MLTSHCFLVANGGAFLIGTVCRDLVAHGRDVAAARAAADDLDTAADLLAAATVVAATTVGAAAAAVITAFSRSIWRRWEF